VLAADAAVGEDDEAVSIRAVEAREDLSPHAMGRFVARIMDEWELGQLRVFGMTSKSARCTPDLSGPGVQR
jgi:hypothetical protein